MSIVGLPMLIARLAALLAGPALADRAEDSEQIHALMWRYARAGVSGHVTKLSPLRPPRVRNINADEQPFAARFLSSGGGRGRRLDFARMV